MSRCHQTAAAFIHFDLGNARQRRQINQMLDVIGRLHRIVQIFQQIGGAGSQYHTNCRCRHNR